MLVLLTTSSFLLALFLVWIVFLSTRKPKSFPPGPPRLPLIGSIPYLRGSGKKSSLLRGITEQVRCFLDTHFLLSTFELAVINLDDLVTKFG